MNDSAPLTRVGADQWQRVCADDSLRLCNRSPCFTSRAAHDAGVQAGTAPVARWTHETRPKRWRLRRVERVPQAADSIRVLVAWPCAWRCREQSPGARALAGENRPHGQLKLGIRAGRRPRHVDPNSPGMERSPPAL